MKKIYYQHLIFNNPEKGDIMSQREIRLKEFIDNLKRIEGEIQLLNEEKKDLFSDFKNEFDPKVLREAVRSVKARIKLGDSVTQLDEIVDTLEKEYSI
jgi:uncharacterized protein (UPF0335 family)